MQVQLPLPKDLVHHFSIFDGKLHHVVCRVPPCFNIARHDAVLLPRFLADHTPSGENLGC